MIIFSYKQKLMEVISINKDMQAIFISLRFFVATLKKSPTILVFTLLWIQEILHIADHRKILLKLIKSKPLASFLYHYREIQNKTLLLLLITQEMIVYRNTTQSSHPPQTTKKNALLSIQKRYSLVFNSSLFAIHQILYSRMQQ